MRQNSGGNHTIKGEGEFKKDIFAKQNSTRIDWID